MIPNFKASTKNEIVCCSFEGDVVMEGTLQLQQFTLLISSNGCHAYKAKGTLKYRNVIRKKFFDKLESKLRNASYYCIIKQLIQLEESFVE